MRLAAVAAVVAAATAVAVAVVSSAAASTVAPDGDWAAAAAAVSRQAAAVVDAAGGGDGGGTPSPVPPPAAGDVLRAALEPTATATGAGVTYAVSIGGRVATAGAVGVAVPEHGVPMTIATVTDVGSIGKQFTAFLVHWLADRGELDLDDDVHRYLPWLPLWVAPVSLRHLLHQVSGLRDLFFVLYLGGESVEGPFPRSRMLAAVSWQKRLRFPPGTAWEYSNTNSLLLAEVLEAVAGVPYAELLASVVTRPLGMNATTVYDSAHRVYPGLAQSVAVNISLPVSLGAAPAAIPATIGRLAPIVGPGGILSTPADLLKWATNLDNNTLGGGQQLVSAMRTPYVLRSLNGSEGSTDYSLFGTGYAAGLFPVTLPGVGANATVAAWWHGGTIGGYMSTLLQVPAAGVAVAIQATASQFGVDIPLEAAINAAAAAAPDVLAPLPARPPSPTPPPSPSPAATALPLSVELPRGALDAVAGVWVLAVEGASGDDETVFELQVDCAAPSSGAPREGSTPAQLAAAADGGGDGPRVACRLLADFGPETLTHLTAASATRFIGSPAGVAGGLVLDVSLNGSHPTAAVRVDLTSVGGPSLTGTAHRPAALQLSRATLAAAAGTWSAPEVGATWTLTHRGGGLGVDVRGQEGAIVLSTLLPCCTDATGGWRGAYTSRRLSPLAPTLGDQRAGMAAVARFAPGGHTWALSFTGGGDGRGDFRDISFRRTPPCGT
ncbi:hypothetical protein I4F81_008164 [Pyropia yezoensis]|uniref:Uncharacterized protein n=1 Tax=Pyropia yezoensis TaxID=2788 RepID=A0ACC3C5Z2_PYRYE|nr:hypothetical protein I4F81_008164 [Neopyropia yezoensis]